MAGPRVYVSSIIKNENQNPKHFIVAIEQKLITENELLDVGVKGRLNRTRPLGAARGYGSRCCTFCC